jgi:hypothetical protein
MRPIARVIVAATMVSSMLPGSSARAEDACSADVEKLCAGIPRGGGRIAACLKANAAQVSPGCKAELASVARQVKDLGEVCADDVQSLCPGVKPGGGAIVMCLSEYFYSVSPACQDVVRSARQKAAEFDKVCRKDVATFCKGVRKGEGRILACLKSKEAELSPPCQALMTGDLPAATPRRSR